MPPGKGAGGLRAALGGTGRGRERRWGGLLGRGGAVVAGRLKGEARPQSATGWGGGEPITGMAMGRAIGGGAMAAAK
jgi:hypothetical protein